MPDALATAIIEDRGAGREPCAIVATCGSTATTAFDPIVAVSQVARAEELWLHVDAAMAGSAMILPECRELWDGVEFADSLVVNPHKWLGVSFDCSTYFVRDAQLLVRVMSTNPSYLQTAADAQVKNYRDWGIPLGRRMRALKLWFVIREQGVARLQARIRRDLDNATWLAAEVARAPRWKQLAPVRLQTLVLRHEPPGLDAARARRAHPGLGPGGERIGRGLSHAGAHRRALGSAGLDRCRRHRARARGRPVATDAPARRRITESARARIQVLEFQGAET